MGRAKRLTALLAAVLAVMMMTTAAFAAESSYNVWIDAVSSTGAGPTLDVPVMWDGTATDGLLTVTYDPAVLTAPSVKPEEGNVAMYSDNVPEPGKLLISWIVGDAPAAGKLMTVSFTVSKANADGKLVLTGEAYSGAEEENARTVGTEGLPTPTAAPTDTPAPTEQPLPENVEVEVPSGQGAPAASVPAQDQRVLMDEVLSEEEKKLADAGVEIVITLQVSDATNTVPAEDKAKVEQSLAQQRPGYTLGQYLDLSLFKVVGDEDPEKIGDILSKPITVVIAVPDGLKKDGRVFQIIRLHDGAADFLEDKDKDPNTITIQTDRFSTYAIIYSDSPVSTAAPGGTAAPTATAAPGTDTPRTGDDTALGLWLGLMAVCACGVVICARKMRGSRG